ncbi:AtpZ/AtpI family protein [Helicobacter sp.]|uniref:AtpZ/AtpI family protein n=1 Tax=Helicobacter sp. TaxID=218 RepID=UPI0019C6992E|nr:AtpZ/AtpI family protein [Helicobacter sp.]
MENKQDSIVQFHNEGEQNPKNQESAGEGETQKTESKPKEELKYKDAVLAYSNATLGISMVVAVLIGVGIGYGLESLFGSRWLFWLGVVWGVCAAILNVFKAYKRQKREFDELAKDPKYSYNPKAFDEEDDD